MRKGKRKQVGPQKPKTARPPTQTDTQHEASQPKAAKRVDASRFRMELGAGKQERIALTFILVLTFVAYANSLDGQFVYDDGFQIQKNPTLQSLGNIPSMFTQSVWQFMSGSSDQPIGSYYRPLFNILLIINYQLFGFNVFGWHMVSVLLHMAATLMVYFLAREWKVSRAGAAVASLLFGIHPIHSESVAWISGVPDPLLAVLVMSSLFLLQRYQRAEDTNQQWLLLSALVLLLAMFTKETAMVMPVAFLVFKILDEPTPRQWSALIPKLVRIAVVYGSAAGIYLAMRYQTLGFISKTEPKSIGVTTEQALLTIPSVLLSYVRLICFPFSLAIVYEHPFVSSLSSAQFWAAAIAVVAILALAVWMVRFSRAGQKALVLFLLPILPVLNLRAFNPGESVLHDRYLYLPSIGFCILIGIGAVYLHQQLARKHEWLVPTALSLLGVVLMGATFFQNQTWQNDVALAQSALLVSPRKPFLYNLLGAHYSTRKNFVEAEKYYQQALSHDPNYYDALTNQGDIYLQQNKWAEAEKFYTRSIAAGAAYSQTYFNLGSASIQLRKYPEALAAFQKATSLSPSQADAHYNLAYVYQQMGQLSQAENAYRAALQVRPTYIEPRINLASVLSQQGRQAEAIEQLELVRTVAPSHATMLHILGEAYLKLQRYPDAIKVLNQLASVNQQHQFVHTNLGLAYEGSGNIEAARQSFQKAVEVAPSAQITNVAREHLVRLGSK
ncbi:MAG TPA: tetratricopeptide repeat protein [Pyrinomonadaceae bacterium]|nr:tetratricopeptide repeat protein [Pyrinomonadaceae bacterium]